MKIVVTRDTLGRVLGVFILAVFILLLAYLATAWIWWDANPGSWTMEARTTALAFVVGFIAIRWIASSITIAPAVHEE